MGYSSILALHTISQTESQAYAWPRFMNGGQCGDFIQRCLWKSSMDV